jgi:hypothetical protein
VDTRQSRTDKKHRRERPLNVRYSQNELALHDDRYVRFARANSGRSDKEAIDPGCVKTSANEKFAEFFSLLSCPGQPSTVLLFFKLIEVETKFLFANSISEFSRNQDPLRKCSALRASAINLRIGP